REPGAGDDPLAQRRAAGAGRGAGPQATDSDGRRPPALPRGDQARRLQAVADARVPGGGAVMGAVIKGELQGLEGVLARLRGLKQGARNKVLRPALAKGARIVAKAVKAQVKALVRRRTGLLEKSVGSVVVAEGGTVVGLVRPRAKF